MFLVGTSIGRREARPPALRREMLYRDARSTANWRQLGISADAVLLQHGNQGGEEQNWIVPLNAAVARSGQRHQVIPQSSRYAIANNVSAYRISIRRGDLFQGGTGAGVRTVHRLRSRRSGWPETESTFLSDLREHGALVCRHPPRPHQYCVGRPFDPRFPPPFRSVWEESEARLALNWLPTSAFCHGSSPASPSTEFYCYHSF